MPIVRGLTPSPASPPAVRTRVSRCRCTPSPRASPVRVAPAPPAPHAPTPSLFRLARALVELQLQ
eukprot:6909746-Prymnesium_polylepis.1